MSFDGTIWSWVLLALLVAQRLLELRIAERNTKALLANGAVEHGASHYPLFLILHSAWISSLAAWIWITGPDIIWPWAVLFFILQAGRVWVLKTLGRFWTTRIITVPDAPVIKSGPFRFVRHPNYLIVVLEIAVVPLALQAMSLAAIFSALNAMLLIYRISVEDRVLRPRRILADGTAEPKAR